MQTLWEHRYAQRTQRMKSSAIRELLKLTEDPEVISFAGGMPAPEVFPSKEFAEACARVLRDRPAQALQYGSTEGFTPLREMIVQRTNRSGLQVSTQNVLITSGSQQALDLLGKIFINPGDHILVEAPTYLGALQAWNAYGAEYMTVASDDDGMRTDDLERALRCGPKLLYVLPNFQNPGGTTLSLERRYRLVELANHYGVPIIEYDPDGELRFEGDPLPSILLLDREFHKNDPDATGNVIYLSTFSKTLAPGIRLAWVVAPAEVTRKLVLAKQGCDLNTAVLTQMVASEICKDNFLDRHIPRITACYHERRDVMLDSLTEFMPEGVRWTHPMGGLFLWVTLPPHLSTTTIFPEAVAQKVAFVPGESFFPCGGGENTMRLNFSYSNPQLIATGIERLSRVIRKHL